MSIEIGWNSARNSICQEFQHKRECKWISWRDSRRMHDRRSESTLILLRKQLLSWICKQGNYNCPETRFQEWRQHFHWLRSTALRSSPGMRWDTDQTWNNADSTHQYTHFRSTNQWMTCNESVAVRQEGKSLSVPCIQETPNDQLFEGLIWTRIPMHSKGNGQRKSLVQRERTPFGMKKDFSEQHW
jgi:hypothetical protein